MIVGSYVLHLYCDCALCAKNREMTPKEFSERSERKAFGEARKLGWKFYHGPNGMLTTAPGHPSPARAEKA